MNLQSRIFFVQNCIGGGVGVGGGINIIVCPIRTQLYMYALDAFKRKYVLFFLFLSVGKGVYLSSYELQDLLNQQTVKDVCHL